MKKVIIKLCVPRFSAPFSFTHLSHPTNATINHFSFSWHVARERLADKFKLLPN